jgi:uncharacterized coiled-coil DUF342 family protein
LEESEVSQHQGNPTELAARERRRQAIAALETDRAKLTSQIDTRNEQRAKALADAREFSAKRDEIDEKIAAIKAEAAKPVVSAED